MRCVRCSPVYLPAEHRPHRSSRATPVLAKSALMLAKTVYDIFDVRAGQRGLKLASCASRASQDCLVPGESLWCQAGSAPGPHQRPLIPTAGASLASRCVHCRRQGTLPARTDARTHTHVYKHMHALTETLSVTHMNSHTPKRDTQARTQTH